MRVLHDSGSVRRDFRLETVNPSAACVPRGADACMAHIGSLPDRKRMPTVNNAMLVIAASVLSLSSCGSVSLASAADTSSSGGLNVPEPPPASSPSAPPVGSPHTGGAPVIANESVVTGEVVDLSVIDSSLVNVRPTRMLTRIRLRIVCVQGVPPKANFLDGKAGEVIEMYSRDVIPAPLVGTTVNWRIVFRGDERGGSYWISGPAERGSLCSESQR
jgi:hypothetical protein